MRRRGNQRISGYDGCIYLSLHLKNAGPDFKVIFKSPTSSQIRSCILAVVALREMGGKTKKICEFSNLLCFFDTAAELSYVKARMNLFERLLSNLYP